jgi:diguanylate cyclase (GGDEF)-like protein
MSANPAHTAALPIDEAAFLKLPDTLLLVFDKKGRLLQASEAWQRLLDIDGDEILKGGCAALIHPEDRAECQARIALLDAERPDERFACRCLPASGNDIKLIWNVHFEPATGLFYAAAHETAMRLSEGAQPADEGVDPLTGLPDRVLFMDRLEHALRRAERKADTSFALLRGGIDRFKVINQSLGHKMGDLLLMNVGNLIRNVIRPTDMVSRYIGDEFVILLEDTRDVSSPIQVVSRIQQKLQVPFTLNGHEVFSTASFGIVVSGHGQQYQDAESMLRDASLAMVRAKEHGGGSCMMFDRGMHDAAMRKLSLEADLRIALKKEQFQAYYQPIVDLQSGKLAGFEALVRWQHPQRGLIPPGEFIPLAEETGLVVPLGNWMLKESCRQLQLWRSTLPGAKDLTVSVNLSPKQVLQPQTKAEVENALAASGLDPRALKLEVTESGMMQNLKQAVQLLSELKEMGIRILLDDFGTGYSSLAYLRLLPIDMLKVDRSFVQNLHEKNEDRVFVETIVRLAHTLSQQVICEGVELQEQEKILSGIAVDYTQGYLYSRPVAANEAEMLILTGFQKS